CFLFYYCYLLNLRSFPTRRSSDLNPWFTQHPNGDDLKEAENREFPIMQMTYNELKKFDVGRKEHHLFPKQRKLPASIPLLEDVIDRKSTRLNSSHVKISYAVFCLK